MIKIKHKCVGLDLFEIKVKKGFFSSWKTIYEGNLPLRVKGKELNRTKEEVLRRLL